MKKFLELVEARGETIVFTFGRFNPPTTGHEKLIKKVASVAKANGGADYRIYPSHSQNQKKDPLPHSKKVAYMRKMFPKHSRNIVADKSALTAINIATNLHTEGYKNLIMVVGSDRVQDFEGLLKKYNGVEARHGFYEFDTIQVLSAGERDPDAEGVTGMSASKMRAAAAQNDYDSFKKGLPDGFTMGEKLFADIRKNMGIREDYQFTEEDIERDLYVRGEIFKIGQVVENLSDGTSGQIVRRGTNYVQYVDEDNTVHRAFLYDLQERKVAQDADVKDLPGTQPKKYYKGLSDKEKEARAKQFARQAKKDDDDPSAYKAPPGNKDAKTKPSKYTKKYHQMFGDEVQLDEKIKGLVNKAEKSGIPYSILKQVYDRGMAAWKTGHRPGATQQQWAYARVNSFITGGKTRTTADKDLWAKAKSKKEGYELIPVVEEAACPVATQKVDVNTKNRNSTIKNHMYGPLNVDEPADYWEKIADKWDTSVEAAKKSLCGNCVAFDISPRMDECMPGPVSDDDGRLGYCWMHHFKCHSARSCDTWAKGGPITDDKISYEWQTRAFGEELDEARAKKAVAGGKVQKLVTAFGMSYKGKNYDEIDLELVGIDNSSQVVTFRILHPREHIGDEVKIPFKTLRRGRFMATDTSKINEESELDEMPRWLKEPLSKVLHKKGYDKAKEVLQQILDRKVKEAGGKKKLPHSIEYYAQRVAQQFQGVDARALADMVDESYEIGTDEYANHTKEVTPGQTPEKKKSKKKDTIQEAVDYHIEHNIPVKKSIFRPYSENYYAFFVEMRRLYNEGHLKIDDSFDRQLLESDAGEVVEYKGQQVPLDIPLSEEEDKELNKPKRGGSKKFYVYVRDPKTKNIIKVSFGDTSGLKVKLDDPEARKSFVARHKCDTANDKTTARYWSCRLPYYADELGLENGGNFFW